MTLNRSPLRLLRRRAGMTQDRLSALSGVSRRTISRAECGVTRLDTRNTAALAAVLGVDVDDLDDPPPPVDADALERARWEVGRLAAVAEDLTERGVVALDLIASVRRALSEHEVRR